jgi:hypothetical protein
MMPGPEVDVAEGMDMVEGMDSMEAMALMGIMDSTDGMEGMDSTDGVEGMVSMGIMDSTAIPVSAPYLSPGLIADTTHTTRRHPYTPSPSTGTTARIPRAIIHTSRVAGVVGCQSSRKAPLDSQQGVA